MTASINHRRQKRLLGKLKVISELVIKTGIHIGGGGEKLEIGGLDKPVIRDPITLHPYLPGSSIKGKLRSILERLEAKPVNRKGGSGTYRYESDDLEDGYTEIENTTPIKFMGARRCPVSRIFGSTGANCWIKTSIVTEQGLESVNNSPKPRRDLEGDEEFKLVRGRNSPARLIVRDCHLVETSATELEDVDTGLYMTEWKFENGLDRVTAAANPRQVERVPKGARFNFEMIYTVETESAEPNNSDEINQAFADANNDLRNLLRALLILEDDALGGHGSRGYGNVKFEMLQFVYHDYQNFVSSNDSSLALPRHRSLAEPLENTAKLPAKFAEIQQLLQGRNSER